MNIFIARQPIFDRDFKIKAYELLYRDSDINNAFNLNIPGNVATSIVLLNSFLNFGLKRLVGEEKAYFNFEANLIKKGIIELLNPEKIVIEILENVSIDSTLIEEISRLSEQGYSFAMDDLVASEERMSLEDLIKKCDIVKIDFMRNSKIEIVKLAKYWKVEGKTLLAEKVETKEEFKWAKNIGFDLFQGYYFAKPTIRSQKQLSDSALQYVYIMSELSNPEPDIDHISNLIEGDASLTYKLLKMVNANSRFSDEIKSIKHAIMMLGIIAFERWLSLIMVQRLSDFKTHELVKYSLIRTHLLKDIAEHSKFSEYRDELSLLGTLSVMDGILDMPMKEVLEAIPVSHELKNTLLGKKSKYSPAYNLCISYEKGDFITVEKSAREIQYEMELLSDQYIDAVDWAEDIFNELNYDLNKV